MSLYQAVDFQCEVIDIKVDNRDEPVSDIISNEKPVFEIFNMEPARGNSPEARESLVEWLGWTSS